MRQHSSRESHQRPSGTHPQILLMEPSAPSLGSGTILVGKTKLDSLPAPIESIFDSGGGVSIAGGGLLEKWRKADHKVKILPIQNFAVTGIESDRPVLATGTVTVRLQFPGSKFLEITAIVTPSWKGDLLIGWETLFESGINFRLGQDLKPIAIRLERFDVEIPIERRADEGLGVKHICQKVCQEVDPRALHVLEGRDVRRNMVFMGMDKRRCSRLLRARARQSKKQARREQAAKARAEYAANFVGARDVAG